MCVKVEVDITVSSGDLEVLPEVVAFFEILIDISHVVVLKLVTYVVVLNHARRTDDLDGGREEGRTGKPKSALVLTGVVGGKSLRLRWWPTRGVVLFDLDLLVSGGGCCMPDMLPEIGFPWAVDGL